MKLKALKEIMKQLIILLLVLVAGYKGKSQTITIKDSSLHSLADSLRIGTENLTQCLKQP